MATAPSRNAKKIESINDLSMVEIAHILGGENAEERLSTKALQEAQLLMTLSELGGGQAGDDNIVHEGTRFVIPAGTTKRQAAKALTDAAAAEEKVHNYSRTFKYRPWDGAWAFDQVVRKFFGMMVGRSTFDFFGKEHPPQRLTINIDYNATVQVPWGECEIPLMPGAVLALSAIQDREWGPLFHMEVNAPGKFRYQIEGMFKLIEQELATNSLYRGKAIDGKIEASFLDLSAVDWDAVIYSDETTEQLEANIWSILRHTKAQLDNGLPLKRANLLEGPFGTGKTLAAFLTADCATQNGWTFLYCRPSVDDIQYVMQTARLYQPAVVFSEDIEQMTGNEQGQNAIHKMLDLFDGIQAKGTKILAILTTNHKERITKAMLRPGRLDAVITIGKLDIAGMERMVKANITADMLAEDLNYEAIWAAMDGFLPAFMKEALDRAKRYNIARRGGTLGKLTTEDFVGAARGLRPQLELMNESAEPQPRDPMTALVADIVKDEASKQVRMNVRTDLLRPEVREQAAKDIAAAGKN